MKTRRWISIILVALLLLSLTPGAGAQTIGAHRKAAYANGVSVTLTAKLVITKESATDYFAILQLDEPADFIGLIGADGVAQNYEGVKDVQVQVPNKNNGKNVRVTGVLSGAAGVENAKRDYILKNATVAVIPVAKSVKLSKTKATLAKGAALELSATVKPAKAYQTVTWTSGNTAVASVDDAGLVTALAKGSATITAKAVNGKKANCKITVKVAVSGVSLNYATYGLKKRGKVNLAATVYPEDASNKKITWKSSKKSVATVNSKGVVTAKKKGEAVITATTKDGGFAAICAVYVDMEYDGTNPDWIYLEPNPVNLAPGSTQQLTMHYGPESAPEPIVKWTTSNAAVATVSNTGLVTAVSEGMAGISAAIDMIGQNDTVLVGSASVFVSANPIPDFVPQGASDLLLKGDRDLQLPITIEQAKALFPDAEIRTEDDTTYFNAGLLKFDFTNDGAFAAAYFLSAGYKTNRGIGENATGADVLAAYGMPNAAYTYGDGSAHYAYRFYVGGNEYQLGFMLSPDTKQIRNAWIFAGRN